MKEQILKLLLSEKEKLESSLRHAISNEFNPFAENGSERVKKIREEIDRNWKEITSLVK